MPSHTSAHVYQARSTSQVSDSDIRDITTSRDAGSGPPDESFPVKDPDLAAAELDYDDLLLEPCVIDEIDEKAEVSNVKVKSYVIGYLKMAASISSQ